MKGKPNLIFPNAMARNNLIFSKFVGLRKQYLIWTQRINSQNFLNNRVVAYAFILTVLLILYHSYLDHYFISEDFIFIERVKNNFSLYGTLIFLIEIYSQKSIKYFNLKISVWRVVPFCIATFVFILRTYRTLGLHSGGHYRIEVFLGMMSKNLLYYLVHSFNTHLELYVLGILIFLSFLKAEYRKFSLFSVAWFLIGLLPFVFMAEHAGLYCLSLALVGFSLLLSTEMKSLQDKFYSVRYIVISVLFFFLILSAHANSDSRNWVNQLYSQGKMANNILCDLKHNFPYFPDGSLIYIKNSDDFLNWVLGSGAAIRLNYENNLSIYFEGETKKLLVQYNYIYYFRYNELNNTLSFIESLTKRKNTF